MFDDELMKLETAEASVQIDLNDSKFANESAILIEVKSKADPKSKSEQHLIKKLSATDREKVRKAMSTEIPAEVTQTETPLNKLLLASFYEQNKLYIDAITAYEQAIKMAPDVPTYSEDYEEFLLRNKLKPAAK